METYPKDYPTQHPNSEDMAKIDIGREWVYYKMICFIYPFVKFMLKFIYIIVNFSAENKIIMTTLTRGNR